MADGKSLNFVHIIKETCLMKCITFYEDQCCTSCFKSEGTKITVFNIASELQECFRDANLCWHACNLMHYQENYTKLARVLHM